MNEKIRIYVAGPDVFRADWGKAYFAEMQQIAETYFPKFELVFPVENGGKPTAILIAVENGENPTAINIALGNYRQLLSCDGLLGNVRAFRGADADAGTAFEIGMAYAIGMPIALYATDAHLSVMQKTHRQDSLGMRTREFPNIEDFGHTINLMLQYSDINGMVDFDCVDALARLYAYFNLN